jgi:hypothetical protein
MSNESIQRITDLAGLMLRQQHRVAILTEELASEKERLLKIQREDLPGLMLELGLSEFVLKTGERIVVKDDVAVNIPAERQVEAMRWLSDHGFGGLIKTVVSVEFGRGEIESAEELARRLQEEELPAQAVETVHTATLKAFVKEQLEKGESVPFDLFGVFPYSVASFSKK